MTEGTGSNFTRADVRRMGLAEAMYYAEAVSSRRRELASKSSSPSREGVEVETQAWLTDDELESDDPSAAPVSEEAEPLLSRLAALPAARATAQPDE